MSLTYDANNNNIVYCYKSIGQTPYELSQIIKKICNSDLICFSGRLDPLAHGKMMFLLNEEIKNINVYNKHNKIYKFSFVIGLSTDTTDYLGIFNNNNYMNDINIEELIKYIKSYSKKTYNQKYHKFSSYMPHNMEIKKPLWWWSINKPDQLIHDNYAKPVSVHEIEIKNIKSISSIDLIKDAIKNIKLVKQQTFRNNIILDQWENMLKMNELKYIELTCMIHVSSGFYIRQFVQDLSDKFKVKMIVTDIERIDFT